MHADADPRSVWNAAPFAVNPDAALVETEGTAIAVRSALRGNALKTASVRDWMCRMPGAENVHAELGRKDRRSALS